jgi:hypothetical protein
MSPLASASQSLTRRTQDVEIKEILLEQWILPDRLLETYPSEIDDVYLQVRHLLEDWTAIV